MVELSDDQAGHHIETSITAENYAYTSVTIISRWCLYPVLVLSPVAAMLQEVGFVFHCNNNFMVL